jgi:hypothetical protein
MQPVAEVHRCVVGRHAMRGGAGYVQPGDRINRRVVQADLDWLNENPVRQVNVIYQRGEEDGTSDIVIDTIEEKALTAYAGFANTGLDLTGEEEWSFGFNLANPWRREHAQSFEKPLARRRPYWLFAIPLILALALGNVTRELGTGIYVAGLIQDVFPPPVLLPLSAPWALLPLPPSVSSLCKVFPQL